MTTESGLGMANSQATQPEEFKGLPDDEPGSNEINGVWGKQQGKKIEPEVDRSSAPIIAADPANIRKWLPEFKKYAEGLRGARGILQDAADLPKPGNFAEADTVRDMTKEFTTAAGNNLDVLADSFDQMAELLGQAADRLEGGEKKNIGMNDPGLIERFAGNRKRLEGVSDS
jgi:hypothetical protein